jgi:hypothetical protein
MGAEVYPSPGTPGATGATGPTGPAGPASNGIGVITGDLTTPAASSPAQSVAGTLASVGTPGTYGSASLIPVITIDAKGRVTAVTTAAPAAGALTYVQSFITADVATTPAGTMVNATSITLAAGTWLVTAQILFLTATSGTGTTYYLNVSTTSASSTGTIVSSVFVDSGVTGLPMITQTVSKIVVLGATTTLYLNGRSDGVTGKIAGTNFVAGDCTGITAVKIA